MSAPCSSTAAVRAGIDCDSAHGAVMPPIYLSSNYSFAGFGEKRKYDYTRSGNPTRDTLAGALAELEGGAGGVVTATGMAAVVLVAILLEPGELLLAPHDCYGGTWRLFNAQAQRGLYRVAFVDFHDPLALAAALAEKPKLVWIETPSNPLLRITDIRHVVESAHATGALAAVDNTFLSPVLQKPFTFNADIVVHSTTKYINGHSDVVGGAVLWRDAALGEKLAWWCNCLGLSPRCASSITRALNRTQAMLWPNASRQDLAPCWALSSNTANWAHVRSSKGSSTSPWPSPSAAWKAWSAIRPA